MPDFVIPTNTVFPIRIPLGGGGGGGFTVVNATADINADYSQLIDADSTGGAFNVQLPLASTASPAGNAIIVKNETGSNPIDVVVNVGDTIDGGGSRTLSAGQYLYLVSDGISNWIVVSQASAGGGGGSLTVVNKTADYNAAFNDFVVGNPPASTPFTVTLPLANGAGGAASNVVAFRNISTGTDAVRVVAQTGDSINGVIAGTILIPPNSTLYLVSDGVTSWNSTVNQEVSGIINAADFGAYPLGQFETNCNLPAGGTVVDMGSLTGLLPGMYVAIQGAGAANGYGGFLWHSARILSINTGASTITIDTPSITATAPGGISVIRQDNAPAIQAALDAFPGGANVAGVVNLGLGQFWCNSTIRIRRHGLTFTGMSGTGTELLFPCGVAGIIVVSSYSPDAGGNYGDNLVMQSCYVAANGAAAWQPDSNLSYDYTYPVRPTVVNGLCAILVAFTGDGKTGLVEPTWSVVPGTLITDNHVTWLMVKADGVTIYAGNVTLRLVKEYGFAGDGCFIYGDPSGTPNSNSDLWMLDRCSFLQNQNHGIHVLGGAANAGGAYAVSGSGNNFYGFLDESDLGNTYVGCHTESNAGCYKATSGNGPSLYLNCYAEGGQTGFLSTGVSFAVGGELPVDAANVGVVLNEGFFINGVTFANGHSPRGRSIAVTSGSGPLEQFFSFFLDNGDTLEVQEEAASAGTSGYNTLTWYTVNGTCISIPFGYSALRRLGLLVDTALQIGQPGAANVRLMVDPAQLINGTLWNVGWLYLNPAPTAGASLGERCLILGRGVPEWEALTVYAPGDRVHTVANDGTSFTGQYYTCTGGGTSGGVEPDWTTSAGGGTVTDGSVSWQAGSVDVADWVALTPYTKGDRVKATAAFTGQPYIMICSQTGTSGAGEPGWFGPDGSPNIDGTCIWVYDNNALASAAFETIPFGSGGIVAQNVQDATGSTVSAPGSFADVPGYAPWVVSPPAGNYALTVRVRAIYGAGIVQFQVLQDGVPLVGSNGKLSINNATYTNLDMTFAVVADGGSHTFTIQWQIITGVASTDQNFSGQPYGGCEFFLT